MRFRPLATMVIALLTAISVTVDAQSCRPGLEVGIGLSALPYHDRNSEGVNRSTPSVELRLALCEDMPRIDFGFASLRQAEVRPGTVRRLDVVRFAASWPGSLVGKRRLQAAPAIGIGWVQARVTPPLPCSGSPVCSEYAPHDAAALALTAGYDVRVSLNDHLRVGTGATGYLPFGCWKSEGWCALLELRVTAILAIP